MTRWLIGLVLLWVIALGADGITWGGYFATAGGAGSSQLSTLMTPPIVTATDIFGVLSGVVQTPDWILAWFKIFFWDFSFFSGYAQIFRWIMCAVSLGITYGVVTSWVRGTR